MPYSEHIPRGNPCTLCGQYAYQHIVSHKPDGIPCKKCKFPQVRHTTEFVNKGRQTYTANRRAELLGPKHKPKNDPCLLCGMAASEHRVKPPAGSPRTSTYRRRETYKIPHLPSGNPCSKCGKKADKHITRADIDSDD